MRNLFITYFICFFWILAPLIELHAFPKHLFVGNGGLEQQDYTVNTAIFDGVNDFIRSDNQGSTGWADGTLVTASFWVKINAINTSYNIYNTSSGGSNPRLEMYISSASSVLRFRAHKSTSTGASPVYAADLLGSQSLSAGVWYHVYWCVDIGSAANTKLYVNGVEDTGLSGDTTMSGTIDLVPTGTRMTIGANGGASPGAKLAGSLAELWVNDIYLDNPSLFYLNGNPVNLGVNGTTPTGGQPCIYFSGNGSGDNWIAQGTAGVWTSNNTLGTDTSP